MPAESWRTTPPERRRTEVEAILFAVATAAVAALVELLVRELYAAFRQRLQPA
jgi:hypothetical protein